MKTFPLALLILAFVCLPILPAHAQTQAQMNQEAAADFKKADQELNKVYPQVLAKLDAEGRKSSRPPSAPGSRFAMRRPISRPTRRAGARWLRCCAPRR